MMDPLDPRHGKYAGALVHWRSGESPCEACARAALRATKTAKMRLDSGVRNRIPLGQDAWDILTNLGCTAVAARTGLTRNNLYRMQRSGPDTLVLRSSRDKILTARSFTAVGVWRRLRALAALGYTMPEIAALVPCHPEPLTRITRRDVPPKIVKHHIGVGICKAYVELYMTPLPASRIATRQRNRAAARNWAPPLAWDRIDDPNERPAGTYKPVGNRSNRELLDEWDHLRGLGVSAHQACVQLGVTHEAITVAMSRQQDGAA